MFSNVAKQLFVNAVVGNHGIIDHLIAGFQDTLPKDNRPKESDIKLRIYNANCSCEINDYLTALYKQGH